MKKLSLFNILLCSFVVLFILGSCSLTVQDYDSASLEIRLPVSSAASQGRALVSTNSGKVYLCLIRANGSAEYFSKPVPSNGKVTFTGMQAGSYADILVVHTTRNIDTAFKELTFGKEWTRNDIESSLAEVIDGYGSIGWTGERTLKPGPNNLGKLTLRPLCGEDANADLDGSTFYIEIDNGTALSRFYQLDFGEDIEFEDDIQLDVSATEGFTLSFELYNAKGEIIEREDSEFWTIPKGTETLFLLVSGSPGEKGASIQVSFGPPSIDFGVDLDRDPVIRVVNGEDPITDKWVIGPNDYDTEYTLSVDGDYSTYEWRVNGKTVETDGSFTFIFKPSDNANSLVMGTNTITLMVVDTNGDMYSASVEFWFSVTDLPIEQ